MGESTVTRIDNQILFNARSKSTVKPWKNVNDASMNIIIIILVLTAFIYLFSPTFQYILLLSEKNQRKDNEL